MPNRKAHAVWEGNLAKGKGTMDFGSGAFKGSYSFASRFEEGTGTNPEELIGAAHAGCFSMAFAHALDQAGHPPTKVDTTATVSLDKVDGGFKITSIHLKTDATVPGIDEMKFKEVAEGAKQNCPVSRALTGVTISLEANLNG